MQQCDTKETMKTQSETNKRQCNCVFVCENQNNKNKNNNKKKNFNARFHGVNIMFVSKPPQMLNFFLFQVILNDLKSHCETDSLKPWYF